MLKNDETGRTRAGEPLFELILNLLKRGTIGGQAPVCRIAIPNHGCETEHLRGDGTNSVVGVTIRRPPVARNTPPSGIMNDLQRPTNLSNDLFVGEGCHVRVRPGVYTNVVLELLECPKEKLRVVADVGANHKVADLLVLLLEEVVESWAGVGLTNRTVVDAESNHAVGRVPDFVLSSALIGAGAYLRPSRILIAVGGAAVGYGRNGDVGDSAGRNSVFEGIKPLLRDCRVRVCCRPFGSPFCNALNSSMHVILILRR